MIFSQEIIPYAVAALVGLASVAAISGLAHRSAAARDRRRRRIAAIFPGGGRKGGDKDADVRRAALAIRASARNANAGGWRRLLQQAGYPPTFHAPLRIGAAWAGGVILMVLIAGGGPVLALPLALGCAPLGVIIFLRLRRRSRRTAMAKEFPGALDVIIRGVKSGLPFNDCLGIVARETPGPLRMEFATLVDEQRHGVAVADAMERFSRRVPLSEANFFAIVITLQTKTGGRLSESLENLVGVLRARTQLKAKIKSMSSEAKASGGIIAALPPVVATLVYLTSPDYIGLLFSETVGNMVLVGAAVWMLIGVAVMAKMINFDY